MVAAVSIDRVCLPEDLSCSLTTRPRRGLTGGSGTGPMKTDVAICLEAATLFHDSLGDSELRPDWCAAEG